MIDYMAVDTALPPYFPYPHFLMNMALSHTAALTYALLCKKLGGKDSPHKDNNKTTA